MWTLPRHREAVVYTLSRCWNDHQLFVGCKESAFAFKSLFISFFLEVLGFCGVYFPGFCATNFFYTTHKSITSVPNRYSCRRDHNRLRNRVPTLTRVLLLVRIRIAITSSNSNNEHSNNSQCLVARALAGLAEAVANGVAVHDRC